MRDHLRGELTRLRNTIDQVAESSLDPGAARSEISRLLSYEEGELVEPLGRLGPVLYG